MTSPCSLACPARTGVSNAIIAPWASASPRSASMKAWLSNDAGRGRQQRTLRDQRGFDRARLLAAEPDEIGDAVGLGLCFKRGELVDLARVRATRGLQIACAER